MAAEQGRVVYADTSGLYALLDADDARHEEAAAIVRELLAGALLHVWARQHAADAAQLQSPLVGVGVALPGEGIRDFQGLLVDEVGVGLVHLGLAVREVERRGGGHDHDEQDDPLAAPEHVEVVAQREALALRLGHERRLIVRGAGRRPGTAVVAAAVQLVFAHLTSQEEVPRSYQCFVSSLIGVCRPAANSPCVGIDPRGEG